MSWIGFSSVIIVVLLFIVGLWVGGWDYMGVVCGGEWDWFIVVLLVLYYGWVYYNLLIIVLLDNGGMFDYVCIVV